MQNESFARNRGHRSVCIVKQAVNIWRLKVYSYGRLRFVTMCKNESFDRNRGHRLKLMVWQAANMWRLKVHSYGRLKFHTMGQSITYATAIRSQW